MFEQTLYIFAFNLYDSFDFRFVGISSSDFFERFPNLINRKATP
jgi:hypothetical protein